MAKLYAQPFYTSKQWEDTRKAYLISKHYICERCGEHADMVHHKEYITPDNINNPNITLSFNNLIALCNVCHNKEHKRKEINRRYKFDSDGNLL